MSVWKYMFDSDWLQRSDIERLDKASYVLARRLGTAQRTARRLEERVSELEDEIGRLVLLNETLLRLLERKGHLNRNEFRALLVEVDLLDGVQDGQLRRKTPPKAVVACAWCGAENPKGQAKCDQCRKPLRR